VETILIYTPKSRGHSTGRPPTSKSRAGYVHRRVYAYGCVFRRRVKAGDVKSGIAHVVARRVPDFRTNLDKSTTAMRFQLNLWHDE